jgi:chromosome segregation ATPase
MSRYVAQAKDLQQKLQKNLKQATTLLEELRQSIEDQMDERKQAIATYKSMQDAHDATYSNAETIYAKTQEQTKSLDAAIQKLEFQQGILTKNISKTHNRFVFRVFDYVLAGLIVVALHILISGLITQLSQRFSS